jgi:FAD dependent oxidoreductase TIGR03364
MHAVEALRRGWSVTHLERDAEPRSATVRNFGMVWISGRAPGPELRHALRARELWEALGAAVPGVGFVPQGSLLVVWQPDELAVLEEVCARPDAHDRALRLVGPEEARRINPAVEGRILAALHCPLDAKVEPGACLPAIRAWLSAMHADRYRYEPNRPVTAVDDGGVTDGTGERHRGDLVLLCPGATLDGPVAELVAGRPLRRVRLQMLQTAPLPVPLTTMLADADSLRYYPGFDVPARARMHPADAVVERHAMQLLCAQRLDGELTVGDTHHYDEPFEVGLHDEPEQHLLGQLGRILGAPPPPVRRRWAGVYSQSTDPDRIWHNEQVAAGLAVVTGPGGRGMTLAPAIAEHTFDALDGRVEAR